MTITVRRSATADHQTILALMAVARGDGLSDLERSRGGFVQGAMNAESLTRFQEGTGVYIAEEGGSLAGFAMTSEPGTVKGGPAEKAVDAAATASVAGSANLFLYGPAAVDVRFQGRGVLSMLLTTLCQELRERFDLGVAFVEAANERSMAIHQHYGMDQAPRFQHEGRDYVVFTFPPGMFASRT